MDHEVPVTQARAEFAELINRAAYGGERIVVTRHGKPIAAFVSAADLERLRQLDREPHPAEEQEPLPAAQQAAQILRLGGGLTGGAPGVYTPTTGSDLGLAAQHHQPDPK
jgi:prevent-host-death family protein